MYKKIIRSPYLNLFCGLILITTAAYETYESFYEFSIGAHHGVLIFGIVQVIKTLPEIILGLKEIEKSAQSQL